IDQARELRRQVSLIRVEGTVVEYIADLARATRSWQGISYGVSPRGGLQLLAACRALALIRGRGFVTPDDVRDLAVPALAHRLSFTGGDPDHHRRCEVI